MDIKKIEKHARQLKTLAAGIEMPILSAYQRPVKIHVGRFR